MLGNFSSFYTHLLAYFKIILQNPIRVSNLLDPDKDKVNFGPYLDPNCLQRYYYQLRRGGGREAQADMEVTDGERLP